MIIFTIAALAVLGLLLAIVLYIVAQKFKVEEDPRIDTVEALMPGANCGGCGKAGCRAFAEAAVKEGLGSLFCPVGGNAVMQKVAEALGQTIEAKEPQVAVLRCNGNCEKRKKTTRYEGVASCATVASLYGGETDCLFGCLGYGDCEAACQFGAIKVNPKTGLPEVDEEKCTGCGACTKACPKLLLELRNKGPKGRRVYVACRNKEKGAVARKACLSACIGCGKCAKVCPFEAITVETNLAYIDFTKCRMCRKCVVECPTGAIHEVNFPPRPAAVKPAAATPAAAAQAKPVQPQAQPEEKKVEIPVQKTE
ncbi:MAG: RnfABCDGE type electron transport complex subunit B [Bacteroidales bacterium]|nr:RnfABCDGE type electron transport complex subunit B [Bacteroidales bacterium]MBP5518189.1 RnfABCDGE type electron transport complex subunit B [Bacteroidales bacterium]